MDVHSVILILDAVLDPIANILLVLIVWNYGRRLDRLESVDVTVNIRDEK